MSETGSKELYAVMFADISGSTTLYEKLGDTIAQAQIGARLEKIADTIRLHHGTVIKAIGDEIMSRFDKPADAVRASCEIHELMERQTDVNGVPLATRIGIHYGPAILKDNDLFGDTVNVAARVTSLAKPQQTLATATTVSTMPPAESAMTRQLDHVHVKGKQESMVLHEVIWRRDNLTILATRHSIAGGASERLVLRYGSTTRIIEGTVACFTLGRDATCDMPIASTVASRLHGKIEHRVGRFVFVDHSANGTYIRLPDIDNLVLRREELPLFGTGIISCGEAIKDGSPNLIHFSCE